MDYTLLSVIKKTVIPVDAIGIQGSNFSLLTRSSCLTESNVLLKSIANTRTASQSRLSKCLLTKCWIANSSLVQFPLSR